MTRYIHSKCVSFGFDTFIGKIVVAQYGKGLLCLVEQSFLYHEYFYITDLLSLSVQLYMEIDLSSHQDFERK